MTLADLAVRLGCRLEGDGSIEVVRVASLEDAGPGDLSFLANARYAARLPDTQASAVIVHPSVEAAPCARLETDQPYLAFAEAVEVLTPAGRPAPGVHALAAVDPSADIGPGVSIGAFASVGARARLAALEDRLK